MPGIGKTADKIASQSQKWDDLDMVMNKIHFNTAKVSKQMKFKLFKLHILI